MNVGKILFLFFVLLLVMQCSQVERVKKPPTAVSAEELYAAGQTALQRGEWEQAALAFNQAMKTNPRYANSFAGAALVLAMREQPDKAVEYAEKAVELDANSFDAQLHRGRVLLMSKPSAWFDRAIASFDAALKIKSRDEEALYYKAEALRENGNFEQAQAIYADLAEKSGPFAQDAAEQIRNLSGYLTTTPRTDVGEKMLLVQKITRADLAALLVSEFNIVEKMRRRNPNYAGGASQTMKAEEQKRMQIADNVSDIRGHWAESWIQDVVQVGAMDVYPDNSFRPNERVQRMNLAMTLQNVIIQMTGNTSLYTAFINTPPRFADVKRTHYAFNAVCLVAEYELMPMATTSQQFDLDGAVSGLDALLALRNLERYLDRSY